MGRKRGEWDEKEENGSILPIWSNLPLDQHGLLTAGAGLKLN